MHDQRSSGALADTVVLKAVKDSDIRARKAQVSAVEALLGMAESSVELRDFIVSHSSVQRGLQHQVDLSASFMYATMYPTAQAAQIGATFVAKQAFAVRAANTASGTRASGAVTAISMGASSRVAAIGPAAPSSFDHPYSVVCMAPYDIHPLRPEEAAVVTETVPQCEPFASDPAVLLSQSGARVWGGLHGGPAAADEQERTPSTNRSSCDSNISSRGRFTQQAKSSLKKTTDNKDIEDGDTSVILKGLPCFMTRMGVLEVMRCLGFDGAFDLVYMPRNFTAHTSRGFCHLNFGTAADAKQFAHAVQQGSCAAGGSTVDLVCHFEAMNLHATRLQVVRADTQGFDEFLRAFVSRRRVRVQDPENLPWVFHKEMCPDGLPLTARTLRTLGWSSRDADAEDAEAGGCDELRDKSMPRYASQEAVAALLGRQRPF